MQERRVILFLLVVGLLLTASALEAQLDFVKVPRTLELGKLPIQFSLAPPGARALGMGGAFIAIADDATASEANPAGLTILTKAEFSFHLRDFSFDGTIDDPKAAIAFRVADEVRTSEGIGNRVDPTRTGSQRTASDTSSDISFASYVKPFPKWVFSIYYNRFANFAANSILQDPLSGQPDFADVLLQDFYSGETSTEILAESLGLSGAFKITERLSFGVSVRVTELDVNNRDLFRIDYFSDLERQPFELGDFSFAPSLDQFTDILFADQTASGTDSDVTYNLGLLWNANQKISAGMVLKKGGDFDIDTTLLFFDCISFEGVPIETLEVFVVLPDPRPGRCNLADFTGDFVSSPSSPLGGRSTLDGPEMGKERITIPDLLGLGLAWRPNDRLTLAADLNYVTYSDLDPPPIREVTEPIDDEIEVHVGGEYVFLAGAAQNPVTIRVGFFNEPDHDGFANVDSADDHFTVGTGVVLKGQYQFDVAASFSDRQDVVLFSLVYRR